MNGKTILWTGGAIAFLCTLAVAQTASAPSAKDPDEPGLEPADYAKAAEAIRPSSVVVEYALKYDQGEAPYGGGWIPEYGYQGLYLGDLVRQERPLAVPGWLLSNDEVITPDPMIHPRFLKSTTVRFGEQRVKAEPVRFSRGQFGMVLKLAQPLRGARPLVFDAQAEEPYLDVTCTRANTKWTFRIKSLAKSLTAPAGEAPFLSVSPYCLIVDGQARPVGINMNGRLPLDKTWKGAPQPEAFLSVQQSQALLNDLARRVDRCLFRVTLEFRSPKKKPSLGYGEGREGVQTEKQILGLLTDEHTLLLLTMLNPKVTARLNRIRVHVSDGPDLDAKFAHTLKDYGALIATLESPRDGAVVLSDKDITAYEDRFLPAVEARIQGEKRVTYFQHLRIARYELGWKDRVYPEVLVRDKNVFLFDEDGSLLAMPMVRRPRVQRDHHDPSEPQLTAATYVRDVLADWDENADPSNIPLAEEQENRLAWLGLVLQPLGKELARMNNVSDMTRNGKSGALVSYVYPDSPAADAGVEPGFILLRLDVEGQPRPIEVEVSSAGANWFPALWGRYDEMPEQYFDRIPRPWPAAENRFTRMLTDLGFGKKFTAEFFHDGKILRKQFTVTQSPPHYDTAATYKCKPLGLTVRDLTYELHQYFRRTPGDPGVIISKIEPGSKASVAGLRPYEIITMINETPVRNVEDFEKLTQTPGELRFEVKRWIRGRVVKTTLDLEEDKKSPSPISQTTQPAG